MNFANIIGGNKTANKSTTSTGATKKVEEKVEEALPTEEEVAAEADPAPEETPAE